MSRQHSIRSVVYDRQKRTLTVRFLVGTYLYSNVPHAVGESIGAITEHGALRQAFDSTIEGKYKSERIGS